jgi:hypothetical protein
MDLLCNTVSGHIITPNPVDTIINYHLLDAKNDSELYELDNNCTVAAEMLKWLFTASEVHKNELQVFREIGFQYFAEIPLRWTDMLSNGQFHKRIFTEKTFCRKQRRFSSKCPRMF